MDGKSNYLRAYCFSRFFFCRCTQLCLAALVFWSQFAGLGGTWSWFSLASAGLGYKTSPAVPRSWPLVRLESALEVAVLRRPMDDKSNYLRVYSFQIA